MPEQEEHETLENLTEDPAVEKHAAHSLDDAVDSNATLQGYYAMNNEPEPEEARKADEKKAGE